MRLRFSRRAEADIQEIGEYIASHNPVRALQFVRALRAACLHLTTFPKSRPVRAEYGENIRLSVFGRYIILYVLHDDVLEIRRVVHGARDIIHLPGSGSPD